MQLLSTRRDLQPTVKSWHGINNCEEGDAVAHTALLVAVDIVAYVALWCVDVVTVISASYRWYIIKNVRERW